jgi:hypothetical protein
MSLIDLNTKLRSRIGELDEVVTEAIGKANEKRKPTSIHKQESDDPAIKSNRISPRLQQSFAN